MSTGHKGSTELHQQVPEAGASTQGGNGARCTMAKIGGEYCDDNDAFARVYNNLLLHEYIYYFTPVHF